LLATALVIGVGLVAMFAPARATRPESERVYSVSIRGPFVRHCARRLATSRDLAQDRFVGHEPTIRLKGKSRC